MVDLVKSNPRAVFALILINILLSLWAYYADPVINNDGIVYLSVAQLLLDGNWSGAIEGYSWPFLSWPNCFNVQNCFWVDLELAAYLLNGFLIILLTLAFTSVVGELSGP